MSEIKTNPRQGNWDETFGKKDEQSERPKIKFMSFPKPGKYTIRLIGKYVKFLRHWQPFSNKQRVITHWEYEGQDPAWNAGFKPKETFAINIIDRADGQIKVLEKGVTFLKSFQAYKEINGVNPAGKNGPDFVVDVEWPKGNKMQAKYTINGKSTPAPLTEQELSMAKENVFDLDKHYAADSLDKIKEEWSKISEENRKPKPRVKTEGAEATDTKASVSKKTEAAGEDIDVTDGASSASASNEDESGDLF